MSLILVRKNENLSYVVQLMFETKAAGPCLIQQLKLGRGGSITPLVPPLATPLIYKRKKGVLFTQLLFFCLDLSVVTK